MDRHASLAMTSEDRLVMAEINKNFKAVRQCSFQAVRYRDVKENQAQGCAGLKRVCKLTAKKFFVYCDFGLPRFARGD